MATRTRVNISGLALYKALHTPGGSGGVRDWVDERARVTVVNAAATAPVGKAGNKKTHAVKVGGTYKRSFKFDRRGSGRTNSRATVYNTAPYARFVEFGRGRSYGYEKFSWTKNKPRNSVKARKHGTRGFRGKHILEKAFRRAMASGGIVVGTFSRPPGA
jgi:hypothetical protein